MFSLLFKERERELLLTSEESYWSLCSKWVNANKAHHCCDINQNLTHKNIEWKSILCIKIYLSEMCATIHWAASIMWKRFIHLSRNLSRFYRFDNSLREMSIYDIPPAQYAISSRSFDFNLIFISHSRFFPHVWFVLLDFFSRATSLSRWSLFFFSLVVFFIVLCWSCAQYLQAYTWFSWCSRETEDHPSIHCFYFGLSV